MIRLVALIAFSAMNLCNIQLDEIAVTGVGDCDGVTRLFSNNPTELDRLLSARYPDWKSRIGVVIYPVPVIFADTDEEELGSTSVLLSPSGTAAGVGMPRKPGHGIGDSMKNFVTLGAFLKRGNVDYLLSVDHKLGLNVYGDRSLVSLKGTPIAMGLSRPNDPLDASLAELVPGVQFCPDPYCGGPRVSAAVDAVDGESVSKCGDKTQITTGKVVCAEMICVRAVVEGAERIFYRQVLVEKGADLIRCGAQSRPGFACRGDSGSVVFRTQKAEEALGLFFARSRPEGFYLVAPMSSIFSALGAGYSFSTQPCSP